MASSEASEDPQTVRVTNDEFEYSIPSHLLQQSISHPLRIAIVDDNEISRTYTSRILAAKEYDVQSFATGAEFLNYAEHRKTFDLVFMDIQMPGLNGLETTKRLRSLVLPHQPIVVALTANSTQDVRHECFEAGMNGFLAKPIQADVLFRAIQTLESVQNKH